MVKFVTATIRTMDDKKDIKGYIFIYNFDPSVPYVAWKHEVNKLSDCINVEVINNEVHGIMGDLERYTKVYVTPDCIGLDNLNILDLDNSLAIYNKKNVNGKVVYEGVYGIDRAKGSYTEDIIKEFFKSPSCSASRLANVKYVNGSLVGIGWSLDKNEYLKKELEDRNKNKYVSIDDDIYWKQLFEKMQFQILQELNNIFESKRNKFSFTSAINNNSFLIKHNNIQVEIKPVIKFDSPKKQKIKIYFYLYCFNMKLPSSKAKREKLLDYTCNFVIAQLRRDEYDTHLLESFLWKDCEDDCHMVADEVYNILMKKMGSLYSFF